MYLGPRFLCSGSSQTAKLRNFKGMCGTTFALLYPLSFEFKYWLCHVQTRIEKQTFKALFQLVLYYQIFVMPNRHANS